MGNSSDDLVAQYKARCREQFSRVGFLGFDEIPRETCWMSRITRDQKSLEDEQCNIQGRKGDDGNQDYKTSTRPTTLSDESLLRDVLMRRRKRIFMTGEGGSGKTELTRHLAWAMSDPSAPIAPLWFELKRWKDTDDIYKLVAGPDADILVPLAQDGRVAFIFDGLDELRYEFVDFSRELQHLLHRFPECTFILAGRPGSLGDLYQHGFTKQAQHLIQSLRPADIDRYIRGYFDTAGDPDQGGELRAAIRSSGQVMHAFLGQPFMLAMTCRAHKRGKIKIANCLDNPAGLVEDGLCELFARRREDELGGLNGQLKLSDETCLTSLSALAAYSANSLYEIDRRKAIQVLQQHASASSAGIAADQLAGLAPDSGVLIRTEERNYRFTNRVIAEFLAARWIVLHGHPDKSNADSSQSDEDQINRSVLDFLSDHIWSIRHRDLTQAVAFNLARQRPKLLIRFINWLVATLPQEFTCWEGDLDLTWTLFVQMCRALHACRSPSVPPNLLVQFQSVLCHFVPPDEEWHRQTSLKESIPLLPELLRMPYREQFVLRLRACNPEKHVYAIRRLAEALPSGFANDSNVRDALLDVLRTCLDPEIHDLAIRVLVDALASGFAHDPIVCQALLDALRACRDPEKHWNAICALATALASGFAGDPDARQALLGALRACSNPEKHWNPIGALAEALVSGFTCDTDVRQALLDTLRSCCDPKMHKNAIGPLAAALASGFAGDTYVRQALLDAMSACRDPEKHERAIIDLADALASGFAGDPCVRQALLDALSTCRDPEKHRYAIRGLARAMATGFAGDPNVRQALLELLGACCEPKKHKDTIGYLAEALRSGFACNADVRKALLNALDACRNSETHKYAISGLARAVRPGFDDDAVVRQTLLDVLRVCRDPKKHEDAICSLAEALSSGFAGDTEVRQDLLKALQTCRDPEKHCTAIRGLAKALASGFANDTYVRQALLDALRACRDLEMHEYAIRGLTEALSSGFAGDTEVRRALLDALRACHDPEKHKNAIGGLAEALSSGFAGNTEVRQALLNSLRACRVTEQQHWYVIARLTAALASGFAGNIEVVPEICKKKPDVISEWDRFVVLLGPRHWLTGWAGEFGEKWGLDNDPVFAIKDLEDERPEGVSEDDGTKRYAVLVAPREKIRGGLDPRLLPGDYIHDSDDLVALAKLFDEGTTASSKGMSLVLSGLLLLPSEVHRGEDKLYQDLIALRKTGKKSADRQIDDFSFESFKGWKNAIRNHLELGPKTRHALASLFIRLGAPLKNFDPDRLPARLEAGSGVERERLRDYGRKDDSK